MDILSAYVPDTVAVVVVNYRTPDDLDGFLDSYRDNVASNIELVLVNVDPDERSEAIAEGAPVRLRDALDGHRMTVLTTRENVGYALSCNKAAASTSSEVLAFFNADTRLSRGIIEECSKQLIAHEDWGILGPKQVDESNHLTACAITGTNESPSIREWWHQPDRGQCDGIVEDAVSVMGSAYFVKRRVWDELTQCELYREAVPEARGAFLPTKHYYEETWCSYHATAHGWKVVYYGPAKMVHRWHKASPVGGFADRLFEESQKLFRATCDHHGIKHD